MTVMRRACLTRYWRFAHHSLALETLLDEFLCLTVLAHAGESEAAFKSRLTVFWTHMLRQCPDVYEHVFSEATRFEIEQGRTCRRYMIDPDQHANITRELIAFAIDFVPVDENELYSRAEASSSPDWFQVDH